MKSEDLYRAIGNIDEKWIELAEEPEKKNVISSEKRKRSFFNHGKGKLCSSRRFAMSLVGAELYKTLISSRLIFVVMLIVCLKIFYAAQVNTKTVSDQYRFYAEYMNALEGEVTEEKLSLLREEREKIDRVISNMDLSDGVNADGSIPWTEYSAYCDDYAYAISRDAPLSKVEAQAEYLVALEAETGIKGWFFNYHGWESLYTGGADMFLYVSILILLTGTFASERFSVGEDGAVIKILRTMKRGRSQTFGAKLVSSLVIALCLAVSFNLIDCIAVFRNFDMPAASAPLASIPIFQNISVSVTVGGYLAVFLLLRIAVALLVAMFVCAFSDILSRSVPIFSAATVLMLLPAIFSFLGKTEEQNFRFLNLFAGTPIVLSSAEYAWFGSEWSMLLICICAIGMMAALLLFVAKRMFVK